jgi:hypothetical protein
VRVEDFRDLLRLLEERPEWRAELRRLILTEELLALPQLVRELAAAQARTEAAVERLAEAQVRTEAAVERLAEAQARTDAQIADLNLRVGHLANLLGADIEADAEDVLLWVLRGKGYTPGEPVVLDLDGELDVALPATDPAGRRVCALVEAKVRVRRGDVLAWARRVRDPAFLARLGERGFAGPYLPYVFGLRVYEEAVAVAQEQAVGLLNTRGERLSPGAPPA